mmetsp:Transcript_12975/g.15594  ORF Transcript_12975/g.15594 Transcript_12975/m.15594 type:complete len:128 (-) Transcript_12975:114-497(-)|eukprot:CAMPEP_0195280948 /NCGR_PEP_ID=MMETSP0707-20130614/456_1 /TAXON_ID=33640 /ORGANISM="Asterionellopsis glacialis, Strain CCMP134" /LENGTH=127 /DNA_ID=CAMNT_0040339779 /DNA_START=234 /DNA_END=617 /DNA_ORIENTATION=-
MPYGQPEYPIVNADPELDDCIKSMRKRDYFNVGAITSASWAYGYLFGKPARMATASTAAALGLTFASFVIIQDTRSRLLGYSPNDAEQKKFGIQSYPPKRTAQDPRYPTALKPSDSPRPMLNWKNHD